MADATVEKHKGQTTKFSTFCYITRCYDLLSGNLIHPNVLVRWACGNIEALGSSSKTMPQSYDLAEGLPASKKLKTHYAVDYNAFQPGSIIRCKLRNFMSYSLTEFHFGPKMNLIIGPNGSGKSTFVCAVCIGLCGKLANLGKESMTTDGFIKDNQSEAVIELELRNKDSGDGDSEGVVQAKKSVVISTYLTRGKKTTWKIDHRAVSESELKRSLKDFNIQLDNLCQFLPQDRVSKFADLKSEDLLKEIERSYSNGELLETHKSIIQLQITINNEKKKLQEAETSLDDFRTKNEILKEYVEKHRHYLKLQHDLEKTELIRPYVIYQDKKREKDEYYKKFEEEKKVYKEFQKRVKPIEETLKTSDESLHEINELINKIELEIVNSNKQIVKIDQKIKSNKEHIKQELSDMKDYEVRLLQAKGDYQKLKEEYKKIEENMHSLEMPDNDVIDRWKESRRVLKNEMLEFDDTITNIKSKIFANERKLESYRNAILEQQRRMNSKDRLNTIDPNRYKVTIQAIKLLRNLKSDSSTELKFKYLEPALVTLNVKDKSVAPVLEAIIPYGHLNAIVVTSKSDYNGLSKYLYDEKRCMVSIRTLSEEKIDMSKDRISREDLRRLGFDGFITDFLSGPEEVIQMLCENVYLNRIPISIKGLSNEQKEIISKEINNGLELVKYVSYDELYTMNKSKFGRKQVSTNIRSFKLKSFIFSNGISDEQKVNINNKIQELNTEYKNTEAMVKVSREEMAATNETYREKRNELHSIDEKIRGSDNILRERNKLSQRLKLTEERMMVKKRNFKALNRSNNDESRGKVYERIDNLLDENLRLERDEKREVIKGRTMNNKKLLRLKIQRIESNNKVSCINGLNESIREEKNERHDRLKELKLMYKKTNDEFNEKFNSYKEIASKLSDQDKREMATIIKDMAAKEILNHESLNNMIEQIKSEMQLNIRTSGENSIEKLEENESKIEELESTIPQMRLSVAQHTTEVEAMAAEWEQELEKIVAIISSDFGESMGKIASGGSVRLDKSDADYSRWRLVIQVSFRDNEELSAFNGAQHSGGEKSTTTAVFLNSLQGLTNTPFRVVDEINQGMDASNERKAHELIVDRATSGAYNSSQYFLITPKLLTGLHYTDDVAVHCIFAGRWCPTCLDDVSYLEMGITSQYVQNRVTPQHERCEGVV